MTSCVRPAIQAIASFLLAASLSLAQQTGTSRTWTSSDGKKIEAVLIDADGETVALKTTAGLFKLPVSRLSAEDQAFLTAWRGQAPLKLAPWPEKVDIPGDLKIDEKEAGGEFIYFSPHF